MNKFVIGAGIICISILLVAGLFAHKKFTGEAHFVTSERCAECHQLQHASWLQTLHPKIFRPVTSDSDILGDFSKPDPAVTFKKEDIKYVVGSKWDDWKSSFQNWLVKRPPPSLRANRVLQRRDSNPIEIDWV
ncbi:MAG: hypothetical protein ABII63_06230 [Pseudomonadota bacterium]